MLAKSLFDLASTLNHSIETAKHPPSAGRKPLQSGVDLLTLQKTVEQQQLVLQTLLMLLLEKKVIEDQEFKQWLQYVDGLDGKVDGKIEAERKPQACPACNRINARNAPRCQYCGQAFEIDFLARRKPE